MDKTVTQSDISDHIVGTDSPTSISDSINALPDEYPSVPIHALGPVLSSGAMAIANIVQAPSFMAMQSVLAAAALATQAHANVKIDDRVIPLSLNCITVAESGERKTSCDRRALKAHRDWEREQQVASAEEYAKYRNELDTWKGERQRLLKKKGTTLDGFRAEPAPPPQGTFICEEPTLEGLQKSFRYGLASQGLFNDEGGQLVGGYAMSPEQKLKTMAGLSKFWDGAPIIRTRATNGESWAGYDRRLSVHLQMQPIVADQIMSDPLMQQQGILARCLLARGRPLFGQRRYQEPGASDLAALEAYEARMSALLTKPWTLSDDGGLEFKTLLLTPEAMEIWVNAYNAIEEELVDGGKCELIRAAASKMAENIARIAGVMAVVAGLPEIDATTMQNAITLGDYYLDQYLLNTKSGKEQIILNQERALLEWLQSSGSRVVEVDKINRMAPVASGARGSVERARTMMQRLTASMAVRCTKFNSKGLPSEWEVL